MKQIIASITLLMFLSVKTMLAQTTPVVDSREQAQKARIRDGVASGEVTRAEAAKLRSEQRHIRKAERRAKADGEVTSRERARLNRKQNKASRDIRRQKNDSQQRGNE